jgi:hypothetical protein
MLEQELKNIWQNSPQKEIVKFEKSKLLIDLNHDLTKFERSIKNRDRLEILAAIFVFAVFSYYAYYYTQPLAKIGSILICLASVFIVYKLKHLQKLKKPIDFTLSMKEQLKESLIYITQEKNLLDTILHWYILPLSLGMIVFIMGLIKDLDRLLMELLGLVVLNIAVYLLNKRAVKKKFLPLINDINSSINELEAD